MRLRTAIRQNLMTLVYLRWPPLIITFVCFSLSLWHTHTHTHTLSLSHTHKHSLSLSHTHTHILANGKNRCQYHSNNWIVWIGAADYRGSVTYFHGNIIRHFILMWWNTELLEMIVGVLITRLATSFSRCNPMWFLSIGLRQGSGLCSSSSRKYLGTEGTNQNRHWNHRRWHAINSLERTRLLCWCL